MKKGKGSFCFDRILLTPYLGNQVQDLDWFFFRISIAGPEIAKSNSQKQSWWICRIGDKTGKIIMKISEKIVYTKRIVLPVSFPQKFIGIAFVFEKNLLSMEPRDIAAYSFIENEIKALEEEQYLLFDYDFEKIRKKIDEHSKRFMQPEADRYTDWPQWKQTFLKNIFNITNVSKYLQTINNEDQRLVFLHLIINEYWVFVDGGVNVNNKFEKFIENQIQFYKNKDSSETMEDYLGSLPDFATECGREAQIEELSLESVIKRKLKKFRVKNHKGEFVRDWEKVRKSLQNRNRKKKP